MIQKTAMTLLFLQLMENADHMSLSNLHKGNALAVALLREIHRNYASISFADFAKSRGVSDKLIRRLIVQHEIAAGRVGRKWILDVEKVDNYFREITTPKPLLKHDAAFDFHASLEKMRRETMESIKRKEVKAI